VNLRDAQGGLEGGGCIGLFIVGWNDKAGHHAIALLILKVSD